MVADRLPDTETAQPSAPFLVIGSGPRNAWTDPDTGLRFYSWQGRQLPSVTTLRRLAGVPHGLVQWQITQVIQRAVTQHEDLVRMLTRDRRPRERVLEKNRQTEAAHWLRAAATEERDAAAELGTAVHDAAAIGLPVEEAESAVQPRLRHYRHWLERSGARILATEFQCWNLTAGYAGTADLIVQFPNGEAWLIDLKTGKEAYSEHALQLTDYRTAEFVGQDDRVDPDLTRLLHSVAGMAILHLGDEGWEFRVVRFDQETIDASRGLLKFAIWMHVHARVEDVTLAVRKGAAAA